MEVKSTELEKSKKKVISINLMQYVVHEISSTCSHYRKVTKTNVMQFPITTLEDYKGTFKIPNNLMKTLNFDCLEIIKIRYVLKVYVNKEKFKFPVEIN